MTDSVRTITPAGAPVDPVTGPESFPHRADDGLFGPGSVAWKVFIDPSAQIGMVTATMLQALNPAMMRLFDKASNNSKDPAGRAQRTGQWVLTTIFADTAHAEAAGESVRRMHAHTKWTDPNTGEELRADNPAWLQWTHNVIVWGVLEAADMYGPTLSPAEQDQLVREMHRQAELVGIDPADLPASKAELNAYVDEQSDWMALILPSAEFSGGLRHTTLLGNPLRTLPAAAVQSGIATLMPDWAKLLYGYRESPLRRMRSRAVMRAMTAASRRTMNMDERLRSTIADVDSHPYRKTKEGARLPAPLEPPPDLART